MHTPDDVKHHLAHLILQAAASADDPSAEGVQAYLHHISEHATDPAKLKALTDELNSAGRSPAVGP